MTHTIATATTFEIYGISIASRIGSFAKQYLSMSTLRTNARKIVIGTTAIV